MYQRSYKVIYAILLLHSFATLLGSHIEQVRDEGYSTSAMEQVLDNPDLLMHIYASLPAEDQKSFKDTCRSHRRTSFNTFCLQNAESIIKKIKKTSEFSKLTKYGFECVITKRPGGKIIETYYRDRLFPNEYLYDKTTLFVSNRSIFFNYDDNRNYLKRGPHSVLLLPQTHSQHETDEFYNELLSYDISFDQLLYPGGKSPLALIDNETCAAEYCKRNLFFIDSKGNTPLHYIASKKNISKTTLTNIFKQYNSFYGLEKNKFLNFIDTRNNKGTSPLMNACACENLIFLEQLISYLSTKQIDLYNRENPVTIFDVMELALQHNNYSLIDMLLEKGVNINSQDSNGNPLIHMCRTIKGFNFFASRNADILIPDRKGNTLLQKISASENFKLLKHLIFYLSVRQIDFYNRKHPKAIFRVMKLALEHENYSLIDVLLEKGANINSQDSDGNTLIHTCQTAERLNFLAQRGLDINISNNNDDTPLLHFLTKHFQNALVVINTLLKQPNININAVNKKGETPLLHLLKHRGHFSNENVFNIVRTLLNHPNIDLTVRDEEDLICLHYALKNSYNYNSSAVETLDLLFQKTDPQLVSSTLSRYCSKEKMKSYDTGIFVRVYKECMQRGIKITKGNVGFCKYFIAKQIAWWECLNSAKKKILKDAAIILTGMALYALHQSLDEDGRLLVSAIGIKLLLNTASLTNAYLSRWNFPHLQLAFEKEFLMWCVLTILSSHFFIKYFNPDNYYYCYLVASLVGVSIIDIAIIYQLGF